MKRIIVTLIIASFLIGCGGGYTGDSKHPDEKKTKDSSNAVTENESRTAFDSCFSYTTCKLIRELLEPKHNTPNSKANLNSYCNCKLYPTIETIKKIFPDDTAKFPTSRAVFNQLISKKVLFNETYKDKEKIVEFFSNKIFTDTSLKGINKEFNDDTSNLKSIKKDIADELNKTILKTKTQSDAENPDKTEKSAINTHDIRKDLLDSINRKTLFLNNKIDSISNRTGWVPVTLIIMAAVMLSLFTFLLKNRDNVKNNIKSLNESYIEITSKTKSQNLQGTSTSLTNQTEPLEERLKNLEAKINALSQNQVSGIDVQPAKKYESDNYSTMPASILYFSSPEANGFFLAEYGKEVSSSSASMYQFKITSYNSAIFSVIENDQATQLMLSAKETNIDPACKANNAYSPNAKRIVTHTAGKATLEGDKWRIVEKATISYE
jgi:hypothetical protein